MGYSADPRIIPRLTFLATYIHPVERCTQDTMLIPVLAIHPLWKSILGYYADPRIIPGLAILAILYPLWRSILGYPGYYADPRIIPGLIVVDMHCGIVSWGTKYAMLILG